MSNIAVILPAAGQSSRFQHQQKKTFIEIGTKAVWIYSAEQFRAFEEVVQLIVVISPNDVEFFNSAFAEDIKRLDIEVVAGGKQRVDSVENAMKTVRSEIDMIAVHDAARPCISTVDISAVFEQAKSTGAAILASPLCGTIKRSNPNQLISETVPRENLWEAQTPQVFQREILESAYQQRGDFLPTDEAQLVERNASPISIVEGSRLNLKITNTDDLGLATLILGSD